MSPPNSRHRRDVHPDRARSGVRTTGDSRAKGGANRPELRDPRALMLSLENFQGDLQALLRLVAEAAQGGALTPLDALRLEGALTGSLATRHVDPAAVGLRPEFRPAQARTAEALPETFARAGTSGATVGDVVLTRPGAVDIAAGHGLPLMRHELTHVRQHEASATPQIHFDTGSTTAEADARAAENNPNDPAFQRLVAGAHQAEMRRIVDYLRGHTSDDDVFGVLQILSHWDRATIQAAWHQIEAQEAGWLEDLADNLEVEHFQRHPRELAASLGVLPVQRRYEFIMSFTGTGVFDWSVSAAEATAVLYLLQGMPRSYLERFTREDGGARYRRLNASLPAAERTRLETAVDPAVERRLAAEEAARREQADQERRAREEAGAALTAEIQAIRSQLSTGFTDWAVTDSDARQVFDRLKTHCDLTVHEPPALLRSIVRELETDGFMQTWIDNMPEDTAYCREPNNVGPFIQILSCRPPEAAIRHAERLLSYGLFDWAITDAEAMLAYHLIRALPESAQHAFRMRDENTWFIRMEANLATSVRTGEEGTTAAYGLADSTADAARRDADHAVVTAQADLLVDLRRRLEAAGEQTAHLSMMVDLAALPVANRGAIIRDLDRDGHIENLVNECGTERWRPAHVTNTLTVLRERDPVRNMVMIRELMSYGLFDWEINCNEARLAYECIRAMPAEMRAEFVAMNSTWFERIDSNISLELRQSREFGMHASGPSPDRTRLLGQLLEPALWVASETDGLSRLRMVLLMVHQAGALNEAWPLVQQHWRDSEAHTALFTEVGYTETGVRPEDIVDATDSNTLSEIGAGLAVVGGVESGVGGLIAYGLGFTDQAHLHGVAISDAQRGMGGHIGGITFAQTTHSESEATTRDVGEFDFDINEETGIATLQADSLPVTSMNILSATGSTIRTGACSIVGPNIRVKWATSLDPAASLTIALASLEVNDLMAVQGDRIIGVSKITLTDLRLEGSRPDGPIRDAQLNDVFQVFERIVSLLAAPLLAPLGLVSITRDISGLIQHLRTTFSEHTNLSAHLGGLTFSGVVDSEGGHVDELAIRDVNLSVTASESARLRTQLANLQATAGAHPTEVQAQQIRELTTAAERCEEQERQRDALRARLADPALSDADRPNVQNELTAVETALSQLTASGSIGSVGVRGLDYSGMSADSLNVSDITVSGTVGGFAPGSAPGEYLTDGADVARMANTTGENGDSNYAGNLTARAGHVTGSNLAYQSTARRDVALRATIEPLALKETAGTILETERTTLAAARAELTEVEGLATELAALEARFATLNEAERRRYQELEAAMRAPPSISVGSLDLTGVSLSGDSTSRGFSLNAEGGSLTNVTAGDFHATSVSGTNFGVASDPSGTGLVDINADSLTVAGADQRRHIDVVRGRITELTANTARSPADDGELQRLTAELARYTAVGVRIAELEPIVAAAPDNWDAVHELSRKRAELAAWETERHADTITATDIHARVTGIGDVSASDWSMPTGGLALESSREDGQILGNLTATGVRSDGAEIGTVSVSKVGGRIEQTDPDHIEVQDLTIGNITVTSLHWSAGTNDIRIRETATLQGVRVNASVAWHVVEDHGARNRALESVRLTSLHVDSVVGNGIHATLGTFDLELRQGSLNGIDVTNLNYSADALTFDNVHLDSANVQGLRQVFTDSGMTTTMESMTATGVDVSSVTAGTYTVNVADLDGDQIATDMEGFGCTIRQLRDGAIRGMTYDTTTGRASFPDITIGELDFSRVSYDGAPKHFHVRQRAFGHGITIRGHVDLLTTAERESRGLAADASSIESMIFDEVRINSLDIADVQYVDDEKGWDVRVASGTINNMVLRGYDHTAGVMNLHLGESSLAGLGAQIGPTMRFDGNAAWQGIDYGALADGTSTVDLDHVSTTELMARFGSSPNVNVVDLGGSRDISGRIEMAGNTTRLRNMDLGVVSLSRLDWRAAGAHLSSLGTTTINGTRFDAELTQGADGSVTNVHVTALHVGSIDSSHMLVEMGENRIEINPARHPDQHLTISTVDVADLQWDPTAGLRTTPMTVDRVQGTLGVQVGSSLSAGVTLDARTIGVTFQEGGRIVSRIQDLSVSARGTASGTDFEVSADHIDTGDVSVSPTEITVPNLSIPTLTLSTFLMDSASYSARLVESGTVTLTGTTVDVTVQRIPRPEGDTRSTIGAIVINELHIPQLAASGLDLELIDAGVTLVLPLDTTSTIDSITASHFTIALPETDAGSMTMEGNVQTGGINLPGLQALMGRDEVWADIHSDGLTFGTLHDGSRTIDVSTITATNVGGTVGGGSIVVREVVVDHVGVTTSADGETDISVGRTQVGGLSFDDGNLLLEIESADIGGIEMPPTGQFEIPSVDITNAHIQIRNIPALSSGGSSGGGPRDWNFLNTLNGHINMDVRYTVNTTRDDVTGNIRMPVVNGAFNFANVSSQALPWYLDMEMESNSIIVEDNIVGSNAMTWALEGDEIALASDHEMVRIGTLVRETQANSARDAAAAADRAARGEPEPAAEPEAVTLHGIDNIDVDLTMSGASTIDLGASGKIHLGGAGHDGISHLTATGQITTGTRTTITLGVGAVHASLEDFVLSNYSANVDSLEIDAVTGATVAFLGMSPQAFDGVITAARARGLVVTRR